MGSPLVPLAPLDSISQGTYALPPWIYPPAEFWPIDQIAYVGLPVQGANAIVVQFQVPSGHNGIILSYANNFIGGGFQEGTGNVTWQIARDGAVVDGYDNILASLGSPAAPTRHPCGFRIFENQIITLTVFNAAAPGGIILDGQLSGGRLMGWHYPKEYEDPNITTM